MSNSQYTIKISKQYVASLSTQDFVILLNLFLAQIAQR